MIHGTDVPLNRTECVDELTFAFYAYSLPNSSPTKM